MKLEISELIHRVGFQATVDIDTPCDPDADLACSEPIRGRLTLTNAGHDLLVRGDLRSTVRVECSRCLKEALVRVHAHIEEEFPLPEVDARGVPHWHLEGEPVETILSGYALDVGEMARQHFWVNLPTAPVCDEECKGLCPGCGKDLNEGPCNCPPPAVDPRLSGLRALLEEKEEEEQP